MKTIYMFAKNNFVFEVVNSFMQIFLVVSMNLLKLVTIYLMIDYANKNYVFTLKTITITILMN